MTHISVPIDEDQMVEIVMRSRGRCSVSDAVWSALESWLENTRGDADVWSDEHAAEVAAEQSGGAPDFGPPTKGFAWKNVFLPNGTQIRMKYKGRKHDAEIRHGRFMIGERETSPSAWANSVAGFTARNAWRDLWVLRPGDIEWRLADELRHQEAQ